MALSHWDARAHLVVARRVFDSIWPSWQQIGAVWLPLPHVLNMLPAQVDAWYRTGGSAIAISVVSMGLAGWALAWVLIRITGSRVAAVAAVMLFVLNPSVLYLQSTPMTEPLLFGTSMLAVAVTVAWLEDVEARSVHAPSLALAAACLTRYEAWPITAATIVLAGAVLLRRGVSVAATARACAWLALYPLLAVVLFMLNSRWTTGMWFISSGFFVPENEALGRPLEAWRQLRLGLYRLSGTALVWSAYAGMALSLIAFLRSKTRASIIVLLALCAAAALPIYAYVQGHPFRIRYDVPLIAAAAALAGVAIALMPALVRGPVAAVIVTLALLQAPPLEPSTPVIVEAHRDARNRQARAAVTNYIQQHYDGRKIMISMGSLAHYMHDLSTIGIDIRDMLHEGNGEIWKDAFLSPHGHAGWIAMEQTSEGGDNLFHRAKDARFISGFERVAEGGGVVLYRATGDTRVLPSARR